MVEHPVTEREPGIHQCAPGVVADDAVRGQAALPLEGGDGARGSAAEDGGFVLIEEMAEGGQALLDVADRLALVTEPIEPHGSMVSHRRFQARYSPSSATSCALERAPTSRFAS